MTEIVKAGWLMRLSSILKRWKKSWFSLSADGYLRYFENEDKLIADDTIFMPQHAIAVKIGASGGRSAPEGFSSEHIIEIQLRDKDSWVLCADSLDDMLAWQFALEQARVLQQPVRQLETPPPGYLLEAISSNPNDGYPMYYYGNYNGRYPSRILQTPNGPVTIVFIDRGMYAPSYSNYAFGAFAGAALASTLWWPMWWSCWW